MPNKILYNWPPVQLQIQITINQLLIQSHLIYLPITGGSHLSHTVVKPDSRLAQIFLYNLMQISTAKPDYW